MTARFIKNHKCGKPPRQPPPPVESPIELPVPPPPPPPEPTPADALAQEQLRAKIESHEAAEQDMQCQIAELEQQLAELRAKECQAKEDERSQRVSRLRAK